MPKFNVILNLPGFSIKKVSGYQPLVLELSYNQLPRCAHCNSKSVRKKASYMRNVHHELVGHRRSILRFKAYKLFCNTCGRYGNQQFSGINKYQRSTWRLQSAIFHQHTRGVSQKDLAQQFKKGKATIERWYHRQYQEQAKELINTPCPRVLGIDEHFFSRKQGFATTLCDLSKHKIFDIVKGRSESDLSSYLALAENPAIAAIYHFQQQLHELLLKKAVNKDWCRKAIPGFLKMLEDLKKSPFQALASLGKTFYKWREEIVRMWRFRKSNGITEGFHRKMKLIQRRAYGFRNFENYRTLVTVLCC